MPLHNVIGSFATGTYTVTRRAPGTYDANGVLVAGATTTVDIEMCCQPGGLSTRNEPSGQGQSGTYSVWSEVELIARSDGQAGDRFMIGDDTYEIVFVQHWEAFGGDGGGDHWQARAEKVDAL